MPCWAAPAACPSIARVATLAATNVGAVSHAGSARAGREALVPSMARIVLGARASVVGFGETLCGTPHEVGRGVQRVSKCVRVLPRLQPAAAHSWVQVVPRGAGPRGTSRGGPLDSSRP